MRPNFKFQPILYAFRMNLRVSQCQNPKSLFGNNTESPAKKQDNWLVTKCR